jgi:predicted ATPase/class 3 adenylate cyclase
VAKPPSGTVTFLFTDIEGSTRLWEERPDEMRAAIAEHDARFRSAIEGNGGYVVKTTGDGFHAAFGRAADAVAAAVQCQAALADLPLIKVRMGMNTGEVQERAGDYFGPPVNRAARLMAAAHGGQIVCSRGTADLIRDALPDEVALVDLGEHRLRDLQSPVHLFQIDAPGRASEFPSLRSLDAYRSNLPYELSSFVGREEELGTAADLVRSSRVASIVGVGGVGKTRLALHVGSELLPHFPDGVWLCELASVQEPDDLPDAVAAAVGYTPPQGVPVAEGVSRYLERKDLLLIIDNCEHLVGGVASFVREIIARAARVSVLCTSREALGVQGESIFAFSSLELPTGRDPMSVLSSEAGGLFVARAREARGDLDVDEANATAVHDLCVRLDGIPLAIELAAAQTAMMTPGEILARLDRQFRLLTGGRRVALERHQTLRAAIDWSYDLLDESERALLDRLSVCVAGFDLDAVVALAAGVGADEFDAFDLLRALVAKSLVERNERQGVTRYRLLEMIRQYAAERLTATSASEDARDDHARHYLSLATALFAQVATENEYDVLERLDTETANVAAAGRWLLANDRHAELLDFFAGLTYVDVTAQPVATLDELGAIAAEAIEWPEASTFAGFPNACYEAATRAYMNPDASELRRLSELARQSTLDDLSVRTLMATTLSAILDGDLDLATSSIGPAVERARQEGDPTELSFALALRATCKHIRDSGSGIADAEEALAVARRTRSAVTRLYPLVALATAAYETDPRRALDAADECTRIDRTRRRTWSNTCQGVAAAVLVQRGEIADGLAQSRDLLRHFDNSGERFYVSFQISSVANALALIAPDLAIELAAICESDAIAPFAAFTSHREMARLAEELPSTVATARARAAGMTYEEAIGFFEAEVERLIAEHRTPEDR